MSEGERLFSKPSLYEVIQTHEQAVLEEISEIEANRLLNTSVDDLCDYLVAKYALSAPVLLEDQVAVDQEDTKVDVSGDPMRFIRDRTGPVYIPGTTITFCVPFDGDPDLFQFHPSTYAMNPPRGKIAGSSLILAYTITNHNAAAVRGQFDSNLATIQKHLAQVRSDVAPFNASLGVKARAAIEERRQKLLNDQGLAASLGFPLVRREDMPTTYIAPSVRRKLAIRPPVASIKAFKPEPELDIQHYEDILSIVQNMVAVMERSPSAFKDMDEEGLRQHFLVQLNGLYEGQATGETFNYEGKTDILIRVEGKNIFIGECKFWKGPHGLRRTIDQLLTYTSWRDTKTAILLFNRKRNFSAVVNQIPEVMQSHSNFKRTAPYQADSGFRYILSHRDDPNRELVLTVLAFDVPG